MTRFTTQYRQHYIASPLMLESERHWMLQSGPTRDLLKTILRSRSPQARVPFFREGTEFDFELDLIIDEIGARDWPQPQSLWESFLMGLTCWKYIYLLETREAHP